MSSASETNADRLRAPESALPIPDRAAFREPARAQMGAKVTLQVLAAACLLFCAAALTIAVSFFWGQYRVLNSWPEVKAQVLRNEVVQLSYGGTKYYGLDLQFLYPCNGRPVFGSASPHQSNDERKIRRAAEQYPVGSFHLLRVNPQDPTQVRLHAGWNRRFFALPIMLGSVAAGFAAVAVLLFGISKLRALQT